MSAMVGTCWDCLAMLDGDTPFSAIPSIWFSQVVRVDSQVYDRQISEGTKTKLLRRKTSQVLNPEPCALLHPTLEDLRWDHCPDMVGPTRPLVNVVKVFEAHNGLAVKKRHTNVEEMFFGGHCWRKKAMEWERLGAVMIYACSCLISSRVCVCAYADFHA